MPFDWVHDQATWKLRSEAITTYVYHEWYSGIQTKYWRDVRNGSRRLVLRWTDNQKALARLLYSGY